MTLYKLTIRRPDDWHVHLRSDERLRVVLIHTLMQCGRALAMPNTQQPLTTPEKVEAYYKEVMRLANKGGAGSFQLVKCLYLTMQTSSETIHRAALSGIQVVKAYPQAGTTGSNHGVTDFKADRLAGVFYRMEQFGIVLSIHGEVPPATEPDPFKREQAFLPTLRWLNHNYPNLKIVMEHLSTLEAVRAVEELPETVAGTITPHHLMLTRERVLGQNHNLCMPVAKTATDRWSLRKAATSGNPKFFAGTDSAPHFREKKECAKAVYGCFTSPVMMPVYAEIFEEQGALERLENFTSRFGAEFYNQPLNQGTITLLRDPWQVPAEYEGIVPFLAGQQLNWRIQLG